MRTFSGKPQNSMDESIIGSVGSGRTPLIDSFKDWLSKRYKGKYEITSDESVDFTTDGEIFIVDTEIPMKIIHVEVLNITECPSKVLSLPVHAGRVFIEKCKNLEELVAYDNCEIGELYVTNCPNLKNISTLSKAKIGRVKFLDCAITSLSSLTNIESSLYIKNCTDIKSFDFTNKNPINIKVDRCKMNSFPNPIYANKLELLNVTRTKSLEITIAQAVDVLVKNCPKVSELTIKGKPVDTIVIDDFDTLSKITIENDCRQSLSLCNLPEIEKYEIKSIKGYCVTENVKILPQYIVCKKMINRK